MMNTILVVDDTPDNLRLLISILAEQGYDVRPASDGEFALQSACATPPDLILLDIKMPDMDGYAVCEQLKADARTRDIPVIFISALNEITDKLNGFALGGVDYITKPFQTDEVLARVHTHLTLRSLQQGLQQEVARRRQAEAELRALNQQLQETNQQLREANASKDTFFSIMAHDLRSPFTGLIGLTEAMIEGIQDYPQAKFKSFLERLHDSAENTYALLTNLLTWSRLQRGVMDYAPEVISITTIATHNVHLFAAGAEQKQILLNNLVPAGTTAYADLQMIETVIRNLFSNALKFTNPGGTIALSVQSQADVIEVAVADTGIGMDQAQIEILFRIDVKDSRKGTAGEEGTGLGLILCKELVEKNGGTIRVTSEVNKGTTFAFTLPKAQ